MNIRSMSIVNRSFWQTRVTVGHGTTPPRGIHQPASNQAKLKLSSNSGHFSAVAAVNVVVPGPDLPGIKARPNADPTPLAT